MVLSQSGGVDSSLMHPNCNGIHPGKEARLGPYTYDQCHLCWTAKNQPEKVRAIIENRPYAEEAARPLPPKEKVRWPWYWKVVSLVRTKSDRGIGDTVARLLGYIGGNRLKLWWKRRTKKDCGCGGRQGRWNREYPYV